MTTADSTNPQDAKQTESTNPQDAKQTTENPQEVKLTNPQEV